MQASGIAGDIVEPEPEARYQGGDGSGLVQVEVDGAARHVTVRLGREWRRSIGGSGLGAAVLAAFGAATTARLAGWAEQYRPTAEAPASSGRVQRPAATPDSIRLLSRAWQDLREYQQRLSELHAATTTRAGPGRNVVVTVRAGQVVGIELAPGWLRTAADLDIERETGQTLRAALDDLARFPERALEGCPALHEVLAAAPLLAPPETDR